MTDEIVNRVAKSSLQQVDLDAWMPKDDEIVALDMNLFLVDNILFMEKHFRESVEKHDFTVYNDKYVYVTNHVEAIVPLWAYMILSTKLKNARWSGFANSDSVHNAIIEHIILNKDLFAKIFLGKLIQTGPLLGDIADLNASDNVDEILLVFLTV